MFLYIQILQFHRSVGVRTLFVAQNDLLQKPPRGLGGGDPYQKIYSRSLQRALGEVIRSRNSTTEASRELSGRGSVVENPLQKAETVPPVGRRSVERWETPRRENPLTLHIPRRRGWPCSGARCSPQRMHVPAAFCVQIFGSGNVARAGGSEPN